MVQKQIVLLGIGSAFIGCHSIEKRPVVPPIQDVSDLKEPLTKLVQDVYEWKETKATQSDFLPKQDHLSEYYVGLDVEQHQKRIAELEKSGFFTTVFLEKYHAQAIQIHTALLEGKTDWSVGEYSPFASDTDPWCNCQDAPEQYWEDIQIVQLRPEGSTVRILWSLGDDFTYMMKAEHTDAGMKISHMEGLDPFYTPYQNRIQ